MTPLATGCFTHHLRSSGILDGRNEDKAMTIRGTPCAIIPAASQAESGAISIAISLLLLTRP